jgi:hypothetical protein
MLDQGFVFLFFPVVSHSLAWKASGLYGSSSPPPGGPPVWIALENCRDLVSDAALFHNSYK